MAASSIDAIQKNPKYQQLVAERSALGRSLSIAMMVIYFGFILLVAFAPGFLGASLMGGVTTVGIPIGILVILSAFALTGFYVDPRQRNLRHADARHRQGGKQMNRTLLKSLFLGLGLAPGMALAQSANAGGASAPTTDWTAVAMFFFFVAVTFGITYWAAMRTKTAAHFYAAGGGITGLQNGLAIAGDYMSAASFLGISAFVYAWGYDGLIYSVGWLVGWPIVTFLIAEPLRNLGKYHVRRRRLVPLRADAGPRAGGQSARW